MTEKDKLRRDLKNNAADIKEKIKLMTPVDLFILFDEDDSGLIDFQEYRKMLPMLDVHISDAKAYRYFRMCDTDGSQEIDLDEFKAALYLCDPTNGNSVGFKPSRHLTPFDAFETFDEDQSGFMVSCFSSLFFLPSTTSSPSWFFSSFMSTCAFIDTMIINLSLMSMQKTIIL